MPKSYTIKKVVIDPYSCMVFSTSYRSAIDELEGLEEDLQKQQVRGKVIFDLLLSHGNTPDRFYEVFFDGFKVSDLRRVESLSSQVLGISCEFFKENYRFLENSVLSSPEKFLLAKGVCISRPPVREEG